MPNLPEEANFGRIESVIAILAAAGNVDEVDEKDNTAAHYAAQNWNTAILEVLRDAGADINKKNKFGETPLECAINRLALPNDGGEFYDLKQGKDVIILLARHRADCSFIDDLLADYRDSDSEESREIVNNLETIQRWISEEALGGESTETDSAGAADAEDADGAESVHEGEGQGTTGNTGAANAALSDANYNNLGVLRFKVGLEKLVVLAVPNSRMALEEKPSIERQEYEEAVEEIRRQFEEENTATVHLVDDYNSFELPGSDMLDQSGIAPFTILGLVALGSTAF